MDSQCVVGTKQGSAEKSWNVGTFQRQCNNQLNFVITLADTYHQAEPEQPWALNLKADWLNLVWLAEWRPAANFG